MTKTNIMHVRKQYCHKTDFEFKFGSKTLEFCSSYKYLGATINEFLNFEQTAKEVADPPGRALGCIVTKMTKHGGLFIEPFLNAVYVPYLIMAVKFGVIMSMIAPKNY